MNFQIRIFISAPSESFVRKILFPFPPPASCFVSRRFQIRCLFVPASQPVPQSDWPIIKIVLNNTRLPIRSIEIPPPPPPPPASRSRSLTKSKQRYWVTIDRLSASVDDYPPWRLTRQFARQDGFQPSPRQPSRLISSYFVSF